MSMRGTSVPSVRSISTGPSQEALSDIRKRIDENNKKHEAVEGHTKKMVWALIVILIPTTIALIACVAILFLKLQTGRKSNRMLSVTE